MSVLTPVAPVPPAVPAFGPITPEQLLTLDGVTFAAYSAVGDALPDRPRLRTTYDRGRLELMTTSNLHEWLATRLGKLIDLAAEELEIDIVAGGRQTFRAEELDRGFEPDLSFWVANEARMRTPRRSWDPATCPPPDLLVEIEVTRTAIDRMAVFAAYRVPEVWRTDGDAIAIHLLGPDGTYRAAAGSRSFPRLPVAGLVPFLRPDPPRSSLALSREFRAWLRAAAANPP
jgi:Uma2 family endonuclease